MRHALAGAQSYILVRLPVDDRVKLFHGCKTKDLGQSTIDLVPEIYHGRLADLDFCKLLTNSETPVNRTI